MDKEHDNMKKDSSQIEKGLPSKTPLEGRSDTEHSGIQDDSSEKKPGAILAAKRIEAGISEEQIASRLKMTLNQVRYLEADNYDALHGIVVSRGFIRAYARVLEIDPEPLVALFGNQTASSLPPLKRPFQKTGHRFEQNPISFRKKKKRVGKLIIVLIVLIVAAVIAWNMKLFSFEGKLGRKDVPEKTFSKPVLASKSSTDIKGPASPVGSSQDAPILKTEQTTDIKDKNGTTTDQNKGSVQQVTPVPANTQPKEAQNVASVDEVKSSLLKIRFKEKSWVRVQKKDGSIVTEYIGNPGEQHQLEVTDPVTVIVGFAPGVSMEFRGESVDLGASTANSVARVNLK